jgi:hypothetical protein
LKETTEGVMRFEAGLVTEGEGLGLLSPTMGELLVVEVGEEETMGEVVGLLSPIRGVDAAEGLVATAGAAVTEEVVVTEGDVVTEGEVTVGVVDGLASPMTGPLEATGAS